MRHTVVLSDLHLWEAVDGDGLWMRYRQRRFFPDESIARLLEALTRDVADGDFELVLNGDIFDFDVPRPDGRDDTPHTEGDAARRIDRILDHHPGFVTALAKLVSRGHRVVFVSGNHDVQLAFAAVRERILARLESAVAELSRGAAVGVRARVLFRAWFHRTRDGVHVEHGHQYDPYCATRYSTLVSARQHSRHEFTDAELAWRRDDRRATDATARRRCVSSMGALESAASPVTSR